MHGFDKVVEASEYHEGCRYITSRRLAFHATGDPDDTVLGEALGASFDMYYVDLVTTENVSLIPGIRTVLENYAVEKHCVLGVLSNACGKYVRKVCDVHDLNGIFAVKYGADDVFKAKPEPEGLLKCSRDMKVQPNCCLYVGDAVTDALAARAAGMRSIGVSWIDVAYITQEFREAFDVVVTTTDDLQHELDAHISRLANSIPGVSKHSHHKVVWDDSVVDNENAHKYRTDNEYWDGRR
jgi:phosphoglycolate phosphatase-like HAD superfamily hydrolase